MRPGGPPTVHPGRRPLPGAPGDGGGMGALRIALLLVLALVAAAGAGGAYLLLALPPDFVRDEIARQVKARTGRDLAVKGTTSFTLYPSIGITMGDVSLSPPPGMTGKPLVTMAGLDASVEVLPLLTREIRLERLVLTRPYFELYTDAGVRRSWEFASLCGNRPVRLAQTGAAVSDAPGGLPSDAAPAADTTAGSTTQSASLDKLALGDVLVVDGTLHYADAKSGADETLEKINVSLGLTALNQPLAAKGDLAWSGEKIAFDGALTSLKAMLEDRPAKLAVTIASAPVEARYDGTLDRKSVV